MRTRLLAATLLAAATLTACSSGGGGETATRAVPAGFEDGVPAPAGEVVLSLTVGDEVVDWDLETIEELEQVDLTILEPFLDEEHTYTGPLWADVLLASGVDLSEEPLMEIVALDDYVADVEADPATLDGLVLATREDGEHIAIEDGGPIRLIFPPDNPGAENTNNWIWSIRTAEVVASS